MHAHKLAQKNMANEPAGGKNTSLPRGRRALGPRAVWCGMLIFLVGRPRRQRILFWEGGEGARSIRKIQGSPFVVAVFWLYFRRETRKKERRKRDRS